MKRVLLVGSYPPPYGGVSVHVQRLQRILAGSYLVEVIDLFSGRRPSDVQNGVHRCGAAPPANVLRAIGLLGKLHPDLVHFHVSAARNFALVGRPLLAAAGGAHSIVTIHSGSFVADARRWLGVQRSLAARLLRRFDRVIAVNDEQRAHLQRMGVRAEIISVVPAFLPPVVEASERVARRMDEFRAAGARIVVASGSGLPHYGFHHLLDAVESFGEAKEKIALALCLYNTYDEQYVRTLDARLRSMRSVVFRDLRPEEFAYALSRADVFARPTDRDGDAVAVREAAYVRTKVVASDCVARPAGAILYRTGDAASLARALDTALADPQAGLIALDCEETTGMLLRLYEAASSTSEPAGLPS